MISITVFQNGQQYTGFLCEGHAGYAQEGFDIVCSAVSALTVNTINSIEEFTEDGMRVEQKEEGGYLKLELDFPVSAQADLLMRSLVLGLQAMEENYGGRYLVVRVEPAEKA